MRDGQATTMSHHYIHNHVIRTTHRIITIIDFKNTHRDMMMMGKVGIIRLIALLLLYDLASSSAPACTIKDEKNYNNNCLRSKAAITNEVQPCSIYLARNVQKDEFYLYSGISRHPNTTLLEISDLILSMIDPNKNEFSPWHNYVWGGNFVPESLVPPYQHLHDIVVSGLGSILPCADGVRPNVRSSTTAITNDCESIIGSDGRHGSAISCYDGLEYIVTQNMIAGEEMFLDCGYDNNSSASSSDSSDPNTSRSQVTMEWLHKNGVCYDNFVVTKSSIPGAGRGAFTKRTVAKGDIIAISPVLHFDRSQTNIVQQTRVLDEENYTNSSTTRTWQREHGIEYTNSAVVAKQLIINYSFGHAKSNVLLLPMAPGVNFINHANEPNAYIRWSIRGMTEETMNAIPVMELLESGDLSLIFDYVAIRDIAVGEEIFIDYGKDWMEAWMEWNDNTPNGDQTSFRHEIGLPDYFLPSKWMRYDPSIAVPDFIANPLKPGYIAPVRWLDTKEIVTPYAFRIGLDPKIRNVLLDYANRVGVTTLLTKATKDGNELPPDTNTMVELDGQYWQIQRPDSDWRSNLHWLSPGEDESHVSYLQALSIAGFDEILESLGQYLALDGLAVFHVTFIATSFSSKGYIHTDFDYTENKAFNIIIPLILANETDPELDIQSLDGTRTGRYKYEYNVAVAIGDLADHGTSAVDYRWNKQIRLAATIYVADLNERNVQNITQYITQAYPPSEDEELLLSWSGIHWNPNDPSRKLPRPDSGHILFR